MTNTTNNTTTSDYPYSNPVTINNTSIRQSIMKAVDGWNFSEAQLDKIADIPVSAITDTVRTLYPMCQQIIKYEYTTTREDYDSAKVREFQNEAYPVVKQLEQQVKQFATVAAIPEEVVRPASLWMDIEAVMYKDYNLVYEF